jgi:hypothetical protein
MNFQSSRSGSFTISTIALGTFHLGEYPLLYDDEPCHSLAILALFFANLGISECGGDGRLRQVI